MVRREFHPKAKKTVSEEDLVGLLSVLAKRAKHVPSRRVSKLSLDPDDDWIIAVALKAKADYLISENTQDVNPEALPKSAKTRVLTIAQEIKVLEAE